MKCKARLKLTYIFFQSKINSDDPAPWFQIDLLTAKVITAVGIQGYGAPNGASWTTSYQISSSIDGTIWKWYQESPGINKVHSFFSRNGGNIDLRLLRV
jgi:hypothetical protein